MKLSVESAIVSRARARERRAYTGAGIFWIFCRKKLAEYAERIRGLDMNLALFDECITSFGNHGVTFTKAKRTEDPFFLLCGMGRLVFADLKHVFVSISVSGDYFEFKVSLVDVISDDPLCKSLWKKVGGLNIHESFYYKNEKKNQVRKNEIVNMIPEIVKAIKQFEEKLPKALEKSGEINALIAKIDEERNAKVAEVLKEALAKI